MIWWLSFCDATRPAGTQFLGAVMVEAHGFVDAVQIAHFLKINPGGEVQGVELPADRDPEPFRPYMNRLMSRAECEAMDKALGY